MKKKILFFIYFFSLVGILFGFYHINQKNYTKIREINFQIVQHPELLPTKEIAKWTSFGFQNVRANLYWLQAIQYIGWNAVSSDYKKYLYHMLDIITELNPFFQKPYLIGQLLLPNNNPRYENLSLDEVNLHNNQAELIGLKWIQNTCDINKIEAIQSEEDLWKLFGNIALRNPCQTYEIPFYQWFLYHFYLKDSLKASQYYKIASMNDDSVPGAQILAAIMRGRWWEREKSTLMFLNLAQASPEKNIACQTVVSELESISFAVFQQWYSLTGDIIKNIEDVRNQYFVFDEKAEEDIIQWNNCNNYINKAIREINLAYLDQANETFLRENGEYARTPEQLFESWYIDFIPKDYQQYDTYGIIYKFNEEINVFDYEMSDY